MAQLSPVEIANWIAIYLAAAMCCGIALILSIGATLHALGQKQAWNDVRTLRGAVLFLPRAWWRWQKFYLPSTPVTLGVVGAFAASLSWS